MADRIVNLMPNHRVYLEPFAGGAAVLFHKPRVERETINDLDGAVVAFWRACRDHPQALAHAVELTPYSREEFWECWSRLGEDHVDDIERARRLIVGIDQSFSRSGNSWSPPTLSFDRRGRWQPGTWDNIPNKIVSAADRLKGVAIDNSDALEMIPRWDQPECLIYCDPPYTGEHRLNRPGGETNFRRCYRHDVTPTMWTDLIEVLLDVKHAHVILSGYPCAETEQLLEHGWRTQTWQQRRTSQTRLGTAGTAAPETVWLSPTTVNDLTFDLADVKVDSLAPTPVPVEAQQP